MSYETRDRREKEVNKEPKMDVFETALDAYLVTAPGTSKLDLTKNFSEVQRALEKAKFTTFPGKEPGKKINIHKDSIKILLQEALLRYPVIVTRSKGLSAVQGFEMMREKVKKIYKLKELWVAEPFAREQGGPPSVGKKAAALFDNLIPRLNGKTPKIGIGGGRTIRDMGPLANCFSKSATNLTSEFRHTYIGQSNVRQ